MPGMDSYTEAAMERAMKAQEVMLQAMAKKITWSTRRRKATQDGRVLRRYRRRWKIERLFAWRHNFRRVVIRWEYYPENFLGMVQLVCAVILLRHL